MMLKRTWRLAAALLVVCLFGSGFAAAAETPCVNQSPREIPVAYQVDVAVVGGGCGAVAAAVAAAESGAKVFLAAPRPYLGDDMAGMLRLWLEKGEKPQAGLAERLYNDPVEAFGGRHPDALPLTYSASVSSAGVHKDSTPPGKLTDGQWSDATSESVQYDGDVSITADLGAVNEVRQVRLMAFFRSSGKEPGNFIVRDVSVSVSDDNRTWRPIGTAERTSTEEVSTLSVDVGRSARYVKLDVRRPEGISRILLGEIEILGPPRGRPVDESLSRPPRPMHVKRVLDNALLEAGVQFLYGCQPTDVLVDARGRVAGIVMANRAGRQAVLAKTVIDATSRGYVARMAGAKFQPFQPGEHAFRRVVIGGEVRTAENMTARIVGRPYLGPHPNRAKTSSGEFSIIEYTIRLPMPDDSPGAWAAADQQARTLTYDPEQQFTSDELFHVATDPVQSVSGPQAGESMPIDAFRPAGVEGIYLLGASAEVSREQAERLLRPLAMIDQGARIGAAAAADAAKAPAPKEIAVRSAAAGKAQAEGDVAEHLGGVRPVDRGLPTVSQAAASLPVVGRCDVLVIGGGTTGAPAGIGAARQGAKTLVVDYLYELGGVGTAGAISNYYWGNRIGFSATVEGGLTSWVIEPRKEWWRRELLDAGAEIWFGAVGCGAFKEGKQVKGAVVASTWGRGVILADVVIDTTGNSDLAAAAGAEVDYTDERELAMQGTGLPGRRLGETYNNTDFTITDETDMVDMWHVFVYSKDKYPEAFDHGKLIDTRERRRIVGDFTMSLLDQFNLRTYPDTIQIAYSNFDSHGYTVDPYLELEHPEHAGVKVNVPYRCSLPKGLEGILVGGLGTSVHRDAVPMTRMQPDLQNQGYALGVAAAMASRAGAKLREIDIRGLQKHLIEVGNLPEAVLQQEDSYPLSSEAVVAAVESLKKDYRGAAVILAQPQEALPLLRRAYASAEGDAKRIYAHVLAVLGDRTGVETLINEVEAADGWDAGWDYRGMGQFGSALSPLDRLIVALGRAGDPRAVDSIVKKAKLLTEKSEFSHHRAVALALELIGDKRAAQPLAEILTQPEMAGYVHYTVEDARRFDQESSGGTNAVQSRRDSIRELALARALYRCGDYGNLGEQILGEYTKDLRGHLARHAKAVLEKGR